MTPEHPASRGAGQPVELPDLRSLGVHHSVILVADDEALIRNLVTLLLQHEGYFVLSAADGHEGLELSRKYPGSIDLVITDIQMPRLNGTDLCAHLIQERPGIKVLVMSGKDMSEIVRQNANMPFLPKPFDGETLKARVRAILAQPARGNERVGSAVHPCWLAEEVSLRDSRIHDQLRERRRRNRGAPRPKCYPRSFMRSIPILIALAAAAVAQTPSRANSA